MKARIVGFLGGAGRGDGGDVEAAGSGALVELEETAPGPEGALLDEQAEAPASAVEITRAARQGR